MKSPTVFKNMPKLGIRPTIDGRRRGVRESLEDQCMAMARRVEKLVKENLRYPDGTPVECVIADTTIACAAESIAVEEQFARENVGVSLTVTPCWCYGAETLDMNPHRPKAVWGFNGTERPGAVYLAAALAGYAQKGLPAFGIYGRDVQDKDDETIPEDVKAKLLGFVRAGMAVALMKGKSYLSMGGTSMGIAGSMMDFDFWEKYLGMRLEQIDMSEFAGRMKSGLYDGEEYEKALGWVKENCKQGKDFNAPEGARGAERHEKEWQDCVKMALIARDLMTGNPRLAELGYGEAALGHGAIAGGFQGQRNWTDYFTNGDFMEAIMNSSFDWNGKRAPYIVATENDALNGVTMLFGYLLTNSAQVFADLRTYWSPEAVARVAGGYKLEGVASDGFMHFINSGSAALDGSGQQAGPDGKPTMKPFWEITDNEMQACLDATSWHPSNDGYFPGGGMSSCFKTKGGMEATMMRLNIVDGLGPVIQIAEGWSVDLPEEVHHVLNLRTDPTWPTTWFAPRLTGQGAFTSCYEVMNNWGANHCVMSAGHIGDRIITMASMLRIPVYMHNVPSERVFRPGAWNAFGTSNLEGADFRACSNYGPLYV